MSGTDSSLDFGIIKVSEEVKLSINLKNKGKHDIAYKYVHTLHKHPIYIIIFQRVKISVANVQWYCCLRFILEPTEPGMPNLNSVFTITPQKGPLHPTDRPTCVQVSFCYNKEVSIRQQPILHCQVRRKSLYINLINLCFMWKVTLEIVYFRLLSQILMKIKKPLRLYPSKCLCSVSIPSIASTLQITSTLAQ